MDKQHILDEIKRTAAENGSKPLGINRFQTETGIKSSDWYGKYWARWNDALREAGFVPNKLQEAYPEDFLMEKLCAFIRELGHFPVSSELRLKAHQDKTFPASRTIEKRFGNKQACIKKIIAYCEPRKLDDIIKLCNSEVSTEPLEQERSVENNEEVGFVYLIKYGQHYKIGRTNAVGRREREIALQLPEKTKLIHSIKTDDPVGIEAYWHGRFEKRRANGEWFALTSYDITAFRRRKFM